MRPRRVLLVTSSYPRWDGDSTTPFVRRLAEDITMQGWELEVLAPHAPGALREETLSGVRVRRFRYMLPEAQQTVCYDGGALINLRQKRSNWLKLPFLALFELTSTLRLLMRRRFAVVNAHWILPQGFVAVIAGKLTGTPVIITVHGGDIFDLQGKILSRLKRWCLRHAAAVTVNSSATRDAVVALHAEAKVHTIPMGVDLRTNPDTSAVNEIRESHRRGAGPLLLFVGRLLIEKGVDDLLRAVAAVKEDLPDTTVLVVGEGQDRAMLEAFADDLGISDRAYFTGWVDPDSVPSYMAAADIFVGPSKESESGWKEGLGLVFVESLVAGTPVVATESGGIGDIIEHEVTGLLVAENAPHEIAASVGTLTSDAALCAKLVDRGRAHVEDLFSREASAVGFSELFAELRVADNTE